MTVSSRPPPTLGANDIVTVWFPETFRSAGHHGPANAPVVRLTLSGEGGGDYLIQGREDTLDVQPVLPGGARAPDADIWVRQSTPDFLATFHSTPDLPTLLPERWSALDLLFLDPRDVDLVKNLSGRLLVEVAGKRRRRWSLDAAFGPAGLSAGRARSTIRLDGDTYDRLGRQVLPPMQALLEGRIKIEGDRALAMQAMMLMATRLSR